MAYTLYPDQADALHKLRAEFTKGHRAVILCMPTGAGKTVSASHLIQASVLKGKRCLFLALRGELIDQASEKLTENGIDHGVIQSGKDRRNASAAVQVASVQTLVHRELPSADLIFLDECHSNSVVPTTLKVLDNYPNAYIIGLTATPERTDGRGLGRHVGGIFDSIVIGVTPRELIAQGRLSPYRLFRAPTVYDFTGVHIKQGEYDPAEALARVNNNNLVGEVYTNWRVRADGRSTLIFCQHTVHGHHVHEVFKNHGENFSYVDADTPREERKRVVEQFKSGEIMGVVNIGLYTQGFDAQRCSCVVQAFKTASLIKHRQTLGRGFRVFPGKPDVIFLDHGGNTSRHGLPDDDHEWSLDGRAKKDKPKIPALRTCPPPCYAILPASTTVCPECGTDLSALAPKMKVPTTSGGMLVEHGRGGIMPNAGSEIGEERKYLLSMVSKQDLNGYRFKFALVKFKDRFGHWPRKKHGVKIEWDLWSGKYPMIKTWTLDGREFAPTIGQAVGHDDNYPSDNAVEMRAA